MNMQSGIQRREASTFDDVRLDHRVRPRFFVVLPGCLLLLASLFASRGAQANCGFASGVAATVTFNAGIITLTPGTKIGQVLWTSNTASPPNPPVLACDHDTNGGIVNTIAGQPTTGDSTLFPSGIPGISYRILHPDTGTKLSVYPSYQTGTGTFSVPSNLQLIYTGPYLPPNNSTLTGQLSQWKIDICDKPIIGGFFGFYWYSGCNGTVAPRPVEIFNVSATIVVQVPTCDIDTGSVNKTVALPNVTTLQFAGPGSTAGKKPFSLQLINCPTSLGVSITLDTGNPQSGATGVIAPSGTSYASGIGVQILQADGSTPVAFGTPFYIGKTAGSNYTINLFTQYYQTGAISPGPVKAVATYTMNYQ